MLIPAIIAVISFHSVASQGTPECVCVPYYLCTANGTIITDGSGILDERLGESCSNCNCTGLDVCCSVPKDDALVPREPNVTTTTSCGYSNPDGVGGKISAEGQESLLGEFPWMVQIFENGAYRCGGSLIHQSVVLTAAHCVNKPNNKYSIRAGDWDISNTQELLKHQDRAVSSIKLHENFKTKIYYNDIALLFLNESLELRPHINLVCLPPESGIPANTRCIATGWGKANFGPNPNGSTILKKVELPLIARPECQNMLRKTRVGPYFNLHESFICAGGEKDKDTCTGDGGGPLFCPIEGQENRYQQVGITAWGIECNYESYPGVYADVAVLKKWIDKEMKAKNLPTTQYQYK